MTILLLALKKFLFRNWELITIIVLIAMFLVQCKVSERHKEDARKWKSNYEIETSELSNKVAQKELSIKDYLNKNRELNEALKEERIRKNRVEYIHVIRYRDTGSVRVDIDTVKVLIQDTTVLLIGGKYESKCYKAEWRRIDGETEYMHSYEIKTDLSIVGHWERENSFELFKRKLFNYGRKRSYVTIINKCDGSEILTNEYINFKKR